jgi:hypothetical protein
MSYGHGTAQQALARAREQLDFCSVTGHAFWPDMPTDRARYAEIIDYHRQGFGRLADNWQRLLELEEQTSRPGRFMALPSYEWHSNRYGDHNVYARGPQLPLQDAEDLPSLRRAVEPFDGLVIPHHIGYAAGYRGIDWRHFREDRSPFVEIFSLHGCSLGEHAAYPMLHDMGPRDAGSTAEAGWAMGHRFGIVGGTDHHSAYPGSHGDGRMGVFAEELTREALWEAFLARRVYAATGDKIDARMFVDDAWIGADVKSSGRRDVRVSVVGWDALDQVVILKNGRIIRRVFPQPVEPTGDGRRRYRLRITWGWGRKELLTTWNAKLTLSDGSIEKVDSCFTGPAVVAPKRSEERVPAVAAEDDDLPHAIVDQDAQSCTWRSATRGNLSVRHATTQALSLEIEAALSGKVSVEVNGQKYVHALGELLNAGRSHYLRGWISEAIRIGPLVPIGDCTAEARFADSPEKEIDVYRMEVRQRNGQWAWLTPIWAER